MSNRSAQIIMSDFYKALDELELTDASTSPLVHALRTFDSKVESLFNMTATISGRLDRLESSFDSKLESLHNMAATTCGRLDRLESALAVLLERSAPRHNCVFCSPEAQTDGHSSTRCTNYRDAIARAVQASKLGLCCRCLKAEHEGDCGVTCQNCRLPHNLLLCPTRNAAPNHQAKKRKYWSVS
ncbi:unnamed protein product [Heligmosomoides polygyrus]|uniref:CCHC-type domain-containing protein n=1 Tax=Heligmosomoides polygyrus TaxID=6339 RepID=A0A183FAF5_HELPZ|nr:unnamed protein product [Heligmosomoides polygyrus]